MTRQGFCFNRRLRQTQHAQAVDQKSNAAVATSLNKPARESMTEYLRSMGKKYGSQGGKRSLETMTAEERSARAKKASDTAAKVRTAKRLAAETKRKPRVDQTGRRRAGEGVLTKSLRKCFWPNYFFRSSGTGSSGS
jgi:hypothetical protein